MRAVDDRLVRLLEFLADNTPAHTVSGRLQMTLLVILLLAATGVIVYMTGGTAFTYLHLVYLPVIIASLCLGLMPGIVAALIGGLVVLGPIMPRLVVAGETQELGHILIRTAFILLVALTTSAFGLSIRRRRKQVVDTEQQLRQLYARNLRLFATLVSERDKETAGHCERVASNCVVIGQELGLSQPELRNLYWAGMLHDLGKLAVPEAILQKPGPLTEEEFEVVKRHSEVGAEFLTRLSPRYEPVAEGVRSHHERYDGSGYPDGLSGEDIPLFARILAVADVFEAVTSPRPYHAAMPVSRALELIEYGRGSHFDPGITDLVVSLVRRNQLAIAGTGTFHFDDMPT